MKAAIVVLILIVMAASEYKIYSQAEKFKRFDAVFQKELADAGIVGSSFVFLKDNKILFERHYGSANLEKKQPVDAQTIYHWASNTKQFTGIAIMQLRDRGLLKLDDPVTKYLPELRDVHNGFGSMDDITIRHLMTHSAGFRNPTWPWDEGKDWEPFEPTEYNQLVAMFPFTEILFKPGSKFSYSNPGIIFLGRIIEKLTGDDYEVYVDKNILKPLEMYSSYFDATPYHLLKYRSHSYYMRDGKRTEGRFDANTGITVSNSGLNSPIADMVKYLNFLIGAQSIPPAVGGVAAASADGVMKKQRAVYDGILRRSSLEEMWKPQLPTAIDANGNNGFTTDIGLIYFLNRREGRTFLGHGGDQNGFISYIDFEPASRQASIIIFNTNVIYPDGTPAEKDVVSRLRNEVRKLY
ncbi:MAG TPA: serine hydrolase domain-containing protein [Pyrinomonadaceae bacterium]|nr:serine hydrolase domain-containing protein [Pyrinomonadaceae bacterium]